MPKPKTPPKEYPQGGAEDAAATNPTTNAAQSPQAPPKLPAPTFEHIPLYRLASSPTNPRKTFDAVKLQELADTIKASGVHTPILVRPLSPELRADIVMALNRTGQRRPDDPVPDFEIVAGERRYRASRLAHAQTIPAMVRTLTDHQVLEIQLIENLQRDDLSALEEASGYNHLLTETGISAVTLATKIGKSVRYVFNRLKLLDCCPDVQTALREGRIDTSRALLLATVPSAVQQKRGLQEALLKVINDEPRHGLRSLTQWVKQNLMLKIADASFSTSSASLVPSAGSCTQCPKRTGANADMFDDIIGKDTPDLCTDTSCWGSKTEAHRDALLAKARATGQKIIEGAEAQELTNKWHEHIDGHTALKDAINIEDGQTSSVRDYIKGHNIDVVIVENPHTKTFTECVTDEALDDLMRQRGHLGKPGQQGGSAAPQTAADIAQELDHIDQRTQRLTKNRAVQLLGAATITALHTASAEQAGQLLNSAPLLRAWLHLCNDSLGGLNAETLGMPKPAAALDENDAITQHIARSDTAALQRMALAFMAEVDTPHPHAGHEANTPLLDIVAQHLKIDTTALTVQATDHVQTNEVGHQWRTDLEAQLKAAQTREAAEAKAQKAAAKNAPLAQPEGVGGGKASAVATAPAKPGKPKAQAKPKTTTQEAITGIAQAMQNIEAPPADGAAPLAQTPAQPNPTATAKAGAVPVEEWPFPNAKKP